MTIDQDSTNCPDEADVTINSGLTPVMRVTDTPVGSEVETQVDSVSE